MLEPRDLFVLGFLQKCAEDGLSPEETRMAACAVVEGLKKQAKGDAESALTTLVNSASNAVSGGIGQLGSVALNALGNYGVPVLALAPPALGAAAGYTLGRATDQESASPDELQDQEIVSELKRQTNALRRFQELQRSVGKSPRAML